MTSALIDACIIIGLADNDLDAAEQKAVSDLLELHERGQITLVSSDTVGAELATGSPAAQEFARFPSMPVPRVGGRTRMSLMGTPTANPRRLLQQRLAKILSRKKDEHDREHVSVAARNKIEYLVTVDKRTMLMRAGKVLEASGVKLVLPSEFLRIVTSVTEAA